MRNTHRFRAAGCGAVLVAVMLTGCDDTPPPAVPAASGAGEQVVTPAYVIGETVTVQGTVTRVINAASFELDSPGFGDRTLLVVCAVDRDVDAGDRVELSGNIQKFVHQVYVDEYRLASDAVAYASFEGEPFIVTQKAMGLPAF